MKRVLIADLFSKAHVEGLKSKGFTVLYNDKLKGDDLVKGMAEFKPHVLVVRSTKLTPAHMKACETLEAIIRAGSGVDTIDIKAASEAGIYVGNCPGKNAVAVAELVFALILSQDRRIHDNVADLRAKKWNKGEYSKSRGLLGRRIGIIGFGYIGHEVARRATAFGMKLSVFDPHVKPDKKFWDFKPHGSIDELIAECDIVTVHVPSIPSTKGMINKTFLSKMKKDAVLVNTSRSDLVNEADLIAHLNENKTFAYCADVFHGEPADKSGPFDNKLAQHPQVVGSHHIGASTIQAEDSIGEEAYNMILDFAKTNVLSNLVNKAALKQTRAAPGAKPRL